MIKEHAELFKRLMLFTDLCLAALSFFTAYILGGDLREFSSLTIYFRPLVILLLTIGFSFPYFGMYSSFRIKKMPEILWDVFKALFFSFVVFSSIVYIFKFPHLSPSLVVGIFEVIALFLIIERVMLVELFRYVRRKGYNYRSILVVGTGKRAQYCIDLITKHAEWGLKIIGLIDEDKTHIGRLVYGYKVIGALDNLEEVIHNNVVEEVVFVVPRSWLSKIEPLIVLLDTEGIKINLAVDLYELRISKAKQTYLKDIPLLTFESTPGKLGQLLIKRLLDVLVSFAGIVFLSPLWLVIAVSIKLTSSGPVFFKQERSTLYGRKFILYKFRTMVENAEKQIEQLKAHNEMQGPVFKMTNDPRVTRLGKILRKFSLDEFPQLWNVLIGDMSLVGPRPAIPVEVAQYDCWQRRRLSMRAGITCIWQVKGRNKITDFNEWMDMDLEYIDNWSLWLDFKILTKTIPVVLLGTGAK